MSYQLLLTTLGQQKLAAAASAGSPPVLITQFAVGQGINVDFSQRLDEQVLVSKRYQGAVERVSATAVSGQYEVICVIPVNEGGWTIREMGLIDSDGDLIWVGQLPEVQKPAANSTSAVDYRLKAVIQIDNPDVTLVIDSNVIMASQSWVNNNFVSNPRFATFLDLAYPYGYPYWSHSKTNPKPLFDAMFGFATHWRRLEGVGLVAVKDGDPYIGQPMINLGQRGTTELASSVRPHTYPVHTSYLFERYDPDTVVETVWNVIANKSSIAEGGAIRFTITANNLPDGQILDWNIAEGELNAASNNIDTPDNTAIGTVILSNGQAIIDYTTTADDNITEAQKHVRLNVGLPANLSINVAIDDKAFSEKSIHITESTTDGIDLAEYYKAQSGQYPSPQDTIRFIVDAGVDIIAANTVLPAATEGANWPSSATAIIENRGRILGRGGDGGKAVVFYYNGSTLANLTVVDPLKGGDGGTAIKGSITVDNYGLIAGGGGGGGGGGLFRSSTGAIGSSGGAGGGAPLGRRHPNLRTFDEYLEHWPLEPKFTIPSLINPNGETYDNYNEFSIYPPNSTDPTFKSYYRGQKIPSNESDIIRVDGFRHYVDDAMAFYVIPDYLDAAKINYRQRSWGASEDSDGWVDGLKQSTNAIIDSEGFGGIGLFTHNGGAYMTKKIADIPNIDLTKNKGGDGGGIGEAGQTSLLGEFYTFTTSNGVVTYALAAKSSVEFVVEPKEGGLAGFIKEGNVIINNLTGGTTKGRTA